jgi:hypothetical protein
MDLWEIFMFNYCQNFHLFSRVDQSIWDPVKKMANHVLNNEWISNVFKQKWEMADGKKMAEFVKHEFDKYENELAQGLPISEIRIWKSISNEKMEENHREEIISIPMRMTEDMLKETMEKGQLSGNLQVILQ